MKSRFRVVYDGFFDHFDAGYEMMRVVNRNFNDNFYMSSISDSVKNKIIKYAQTISKT